MLILATTNYQRNTFEENLNEKSTQTYQNVDAPSITWVISKTQQMSSLISKAKTDQHKCQGHNHKTKQLWRHINDRKK